MRPKDELPIQNHQPLSDPSSLQAESIPELVHQFHVQQVQLHLQNEELRQSQETLAEVYDHYSQLYDFSPSGYLTLTAEGIIEEANLRFCTMVGVHRELILNRPLFNFVAPQDWERLRQHWANVLDVRTTQTCKLRILPRTGDPLVMHMESMPMSDRQKPIIHIQSAILDITLMEQSEQKVRESQRQMQQTGTQLMTAHEDERRRIARDLHDDYCQRLAALMVELGLLPKRQPGPWSNPVQQLEPIKRKLSTLLADLRDLSHGLHPDQITSVALEQALRGYLAEFMERTTIETTFRADSPASELPPAIKTCLYRVTQEGLTNIEKHARAKQVSVCITQRSNCVELLIKDNGRGFDPELVQGTYHLGLTSIRERVEQLGGIVTITSASACGTTLFIRIPTGVT